MPTGQSPSLLGVGGADAPVLALASVPRSALATGAAEACVSVGAPEELAPADVVVTLAVCGGAPRAVVLGPEGPAGLQAPSAPAASRLLSWPARWARR